MYSAVHKCCSACTLETGSMQRLTGLGSAVRSSPGDTPGGREQGGGENRRPSHAQALAACRVNTWPTRTHTDKHENKYTNIQPASSHLLVSSQSQALLSIYNLSIYLLSVSIFFFPHFLSLSLCLCVHPLSLPLSLFLFLFLHLSLFPSLSHSYLYCEALYQNVSLCKSNLPSCGHLNTNRPTPAKPVETLKFILYLHITTINYVKKK